MASKKQSKSKTRDFRFLKKKEWTGIVAESWKEMRPYIVLSSTRHCSGLDASQRHLVDQFGGAQEFELLEFLTRKVTQDSSSSQITCLLVRKVNFHTSQSWVLEPASGRLRATLLWQDVAVVTSSVPTHLVLAQLCNCLVALLT